MRVYNFSAGPAVLPEEVLKEAADEMYKKELEFSEKAQKELGKKRKIFCFAGWTEKKRGFFSVIK